jgi:hypothetical protein
VSQYFRDTQVRRAVSNRELDVTVLYCKNSECLMKQKFRILKCTSATEEMASITSVRLPIARQASIVPKGYSMRTCWKLGDKSPHLYKPRQWIEVTDQLHVPAPISPKKGPR